MKKTALLLLVLLLSSYKIAAQCAVVAPVPNNTCYQTVIANDPFCCNISWDGLCQSAYDACAPTGGVPPTSGDCFGSIAICTNNSNFAVDPNGFGTVNELCIGCFSNPSTNPASANSGCLLAGELNSTWFSITVTTTGTLSFSFGSPGPLNCYDWAMWPYNPNACNQIAANTLAPIRCNWNGACNSFTGVGLPPPPGGEVTDFEPTLNVVAGQQFLICFSNYSSAYTNVPLAFYGSASIACVTLAVEMNSFTATNMRGYNQINWTTTSEVNNSHFELERSIDGINFYQITSIEGNGTILSESAYEYEDYFVHEGLTYYRLNQIDFNGASSYSNIIAVSATLLDEFKILKTYPNPSSDLVKLHFTQPESSEIIISISDYNGRVLYTENLLVMKGSAVVTLPVSTFENGLYVVSIYNSLTGEKDETKVSVMK